MFLRGEKIFDEEARINVGSSIISLVGECYGKRERSTLRESLGVEFGIVVEYSLCLSFGCVERKVDGSSVKFYTGIVGMPVLGADAVSVAVVLVRYSTLRSEVR